MTTYRRFAFWSDFPYLHEIKKDVCRFHPLNGGPIMAYLGLSRIHIPMYPPDLRQLAQCDNPQDKQSWTSRKDSMHPWCVNLPHCPLVHGSMAPRDPLFTDYFPIQTSSIYLSIYLVLSHLILSIFLISPSIYPTIYLPIYTYTSGGSLKMRHPQQWVSKGCRHGAICGPPSGWSAPNPRVRFESRWEHLNV